MPNFVARKVNEATFYKWKRRFGQMHVSEVKQSQGLEAKNGELERLLADRLIEIDGVQELLVKSDDG